MDQNEISQLKRDTKLDLINYYDTIKSEIDINAQETLLIFEKSRSLLEICGENENLEKEIIELNKEQIDHVENIFNKNCREIDDFSLICNSVLLANREDVKTSALKNYCTFISNKSLKKNLKNKNRIGILIVSDWYFNENQVKYIK